MAPRKKPARKAAQPVAANEDKRIATNASTYAKDHEITPQSGSDFEDQTVTTLTPEQLASQPRSESLRKRSDRSVGIRGQIQPLERRPSQSVKDSSPSPDIRYPEEDDFLDDFEYLHPSRQMTRRRQPGIGVRVLHVLNEKTRTGFDTVKQNWKLITSALVCVLVCLLLAQNVTHKEQQHTDVALPEESKDPAAAGGAEELSEDRSVKNVINIEEKLRTEMLDLIERRIDHLELKLATFSLQDENLETDVRSLSGFVTSHSKIFLKELDCAKGRYSTTPCVAYQWTAPVLGFVRLSPVHPLADEVVVRGSLPRLTCFPLSGQTGHLTIGFVVPSSPMRIYIDQPRLPQNSIEEFSPVMREFTLEGIDENRNRFILGSYEFNLTGTARQKFDITSPQLILYIKIQVHSNYGNSDYTCLSRVQFYGRTPKDNELEK